MARLGVDDVEFIRWPEESARRERCRDLGRLRLLVIGAGATPPICTDLREDWIRVPASREDIRLRAATLRIKAGVHQIPRLDLDGMLTFRGQSVALSPGERALLEVLIRDTGQLVARETLCHALSDGAPRLRRNSLDLQVMRARRRIAPLGLRIRTVWGRGYLLEIDDD